MQKKPGNARIAIFIVLLLVLIGGLAAVNLIQSRLPAQVVVHEDDDDHGH
jgi:hypothetical protein